MSPPPTQPIPRPPDRPTSWFLLHPSPLRPHDWFGLPFLGRPSSISPARRKPPFRIDRCRTRSPFRGCARLAAIHLPAMDVSRAVPWFDHVQDSSHHRLLPHRHSDRIVTAPVRKAAARLAL